MSNSLGFTNDRALGTTEPEPIRDSLRDILKDAVVQWSGPVPRSESELKESFFRILETGFDQAKEAGAAVDVDTLHASEMIAEILFRLKDLLATRLHIYALLICLGKISDSEESIARELGVTKAAVSKAKLIIQSWFALPCRVGRKDESRAKFASLALARAHNRRPTSPKWTGQKFFSRL